MTNEVSIRVKATDDASASFKQVQTNAGTMGKSLSDASKIASGFVLGEALTKLPGLLMDAVNAAAEDAASQARLKTAVEDTGASYGTYGKQIDAVIAKGQALGFTDDQTRSALAILTAQTGSAAEAMKRYALAQDLSRGANIDVVTASRLLGKVTDDNVTALNRYGIAVEKGASQTELFAAIQQKFSGQAQSFADTTAGKYASLGDSVHELEESFGRLLIPIADAAIPALTYSLNGWALAAHGAGEGFEFAAGKLSHLLSQASGIKDKSSPLGFMDLTPEQRKAWDDQTAAIDKQVDHLLQVPPLQEAVTASQMNSIRASTAQTKATEAAYTALANSADPQDQAIARTHAQEIADQAASKAKSEASAAAAEYAKTLPGMVQAQYDDARSSEMQAEAKRIYNQQMSIATDLEGNAIPTMQELVNQQIDSADASGRQAMATRMAYQARGIETDREGNAIPTMQALIDQQEDSIDASIRQSKAALQVATSDFPALVEQAKQSALVEQAMAKATDEANRQLGIQTDTLKEVTAAWHQMTDAESQSAAAANRAAVAAGQPYSAAGKLMANPGSVSSGGGVAFFSSGYGRSAGGTGSATSSQNVSNTNSQTTQVFGNVINNYGSSTPTPATDLQLARLN